MSQEERFERTDPYLRPNQVEEMQEEKRGIEQMLAAPAHIQNQIQDRGAAMRHARNLEEQLHNHTPQPYAANALDQAVRREEELREEFTAGMPTQEEMRKAPAGAVDKHRAWERRNHERILEWKNVRLRLHATGMIDAPEDAQDIANIEKFRPRDAAHELPMQNTVVAGKHYSLPAGDIKTKNGSIMANRQAREEVGHEGGDGGTGSLPPVME